MYKVSKDHKEYQEVKDWKAKRDSKDSVGWWAHEDLQDLLVAMVRRDKKGRMDEGAPQVPQLVV